MKPYGGLWHDHDPRSTLIGCIGSLGCIKGGWLFKITYVSIIVFVADCEHPETHYVTAQETKKMLSAGMYGSKL